MRFIKILISILIFLMYINPAYAKFSINIDMPIEYLSVNPGEIISISLNIIKIDNKGEREDYEMNVYILDKNNNKLIEKSEIVAIENEINTIVSLNIPSYFEPGEYKLEVAIGGDKSGVNFLIEDIEKKHDINIIYFLIFIFIGFFMVFFIYNRKLNKLVKHIKKVGMEDLFKD